MSTDMLSFSKDETVGDVIDHLLNMDVLSTNITMSLNKTEFNVPDPNLIMNARHEEVDEKRKKRQEEAKKEVMKEIKSLEAKEQKITKPALQEFYTIEKEIQQFKKYLEKERKTLESTDIQLKAGSSPEEEDVELIMSSDDGPRPPFFINQFGGGDWEPRHSEETILTPDESQMYQNWTTQTAKYYTDVFDDEETDEAPLFECKDDLEPKISYEPLEEPEICKLPKSRHTVQPSAQLLIKQPKPVLKKLSTVPYQDKIKLQLFFTKWRQQTIRAKLSKQSSKQHNELEDKLNKFLSSIDEKIKKSRSKSSLSTTDSRSPSATSLSKSSSMRSLPRSASYTHRFENQQRMIKSQQSKLTEQAKIIQQLSTEKLKLENELSAKQTDELFQDTIKKCSSQTKILMKGTINSFKAPKPVESSELVKRMEERAALRQQRRQELLEAKMKKQEVERLMEEQRREELLKIEKELKRQRALERKAKLEADRKAEEERRLVQQQRLHRLAQADELYEKLLLKRTFIAWKSRHDHITEMSNYADQVYNRQLLSHFMFTWKLSTDYIVGLRNEKASIIHDSILMRKFWHFWKLYIHEIKQDQQAADDFRELHLQKKVLEQWKYFVQMKKEVLKDELQMADDYNHKKLLSRVLGAWKGYPAFKRSELDTNVRLRHWTDKVQELLPDFQME